MTDLAHSTPVAATKCGCSYSGPQVESHDRLLGFLEDPAVLRHLIVLAADPEPGQFRTDHELFDLGSVDDLPGFVAQHNWTDPVEAYNVAVALAYLSGTVREAAQQP